MIQILSSVTKKAFPNKEGITGIVFVVMDCYDFFHCLTLELSTQWHGITGFSLRNKLVEVF